MDTHGNKGFREGHQEPITFQEAENRFADLKQQYDSGSLSAEKFKAQLEEIMVRDSERRWWALHPHTGE